jgi:murein DD-endopeptidase MepM/ murein hydrolase activator NlpD
LADREAKTQPIEPPTQPGKPSRLMAIWESISRAGLGEITFRLGTHVLLIAIILLVAWGLRRFYTLAQTTPMSKPKAALLASSPTSTPNGEISMLPAFSLGEEPELGVPRYTNLHTDLPSRPRFEVMQYTVETGDDLFGIATKFGVQPETILWANQTALKDNPHNLTPGQELAILPVDGAYHRWSAGDGLNSVAKFYGVSPEAILSFPGNHFDAETVGDWSNPNIPAGTWVIVPGGRRAFVSWSVPEIPRDKPETAKILGTGFCENVGEGPVGSGVFIWPADAHFLSGYDYAPSANHFGIDLSGAEGDPAYAVDSGVVVYAGWNEWGYGNMIVINHGDGWQSLYARLSSLLVTCGQTVWQGGVIGGIGATGSGSNPNLHFELMFEGTTVNPQDYLP